MDAIEAQRQLLLSNLLATMRTFSTVRDTAEVWEDDGLLCVYSGLPGAVFNSVLLTRPVDSEQELKLKFEYVEAMYQRRRSRWSLWLVDYLLQDKLLRRVPPMLERYGSMVVSRGAGMFTAELLPATRKLPSLEIFPVSAPASRFDFCHVMAVAFRTPLATFLDVYHTSDYWSGNMRGFVAYSGNRALGTTCIMPAHGVLGVYGVSVLPEVQRKGIGEAIVRHALEEVSKQTGLKASVLESSEIAEALYRRMGYRRISGVSVYNESR